MFASISDLRCTVGIVLSWLIMTLPGTAAGAEVRVVSVSGDVVLVSGGQTLAARPGERFAAALVVRTGPASVAQFQLDDGTQVSAGENTEVWLNDTPQTLKLASGQLGLWTDDKVWKVEVAGASLRTQGYLRLKSCGQTCSLPPGIYGKGNGGSVVAEYPGGRVMLRDRLFLLPAAGGKPELLARDQGGLSEAPRFDAAVAAKLAIAQDLKDGLEAYKLGRYDESSNILNRVRRAAPAETIVSYYLGLIALEQQRHGDALRELQQYAKDDPDGARQRDVQKLLTLLTSAQLQQEVATAVQQEKALSTAAPEPGSIAVQTFANRSVGGNSVLAKGIAAMVITDLAKVPGLKVLERQRVQKISDEIRLSTSGLVDTDSAVRAGRLMRAERVVVGSMGVLEQ